MGHQNRHFPEQTMGQTFQNEETNRTKTANVTDVIAHGQVVNIEDELNSKRIQVKLESQDQYNNEETLVWCISVMPNFFYCQPQVGEHVVVFMKNPWNPSDTRFYMAPIQTGNFGEQQYDDDGTTIGTMNTFGFTTFNKKV